MGSPELEKTGVLERAKDQRMILARMVGTNQKKMGVGSPILEGDKREGKSW